MILIIAEKPSVRGKIKEALKINSSIRTKEFEESNEYILTNVIGHLTRLKMPDEIDPIHKSWRLDNLPFFFEDIPLAENPNTISQWKVVKKLLHDKRVTEIVNACDPDREGELIFRNTIELAKINKNIKVTRMRIISSTPEGIRQAFNEREPSELYDNLGSAAKARSYADYYVGLNSTMAITAKINNGTYSVGRVQTPVLKIIVDLEREIKNFVSKKYFKVFGDFRTKNGLEFNANYQNDDLEQNAFETRIKAEELVKKVGIGPCEITELEEKMKDEFSPSLFDLSGLQIEMNKKFGYTADETLKIAQTLYEKYALITYPRTSETKISQKFASQSRDIIKNMPVFKEFTGKIIENDWKIKKKHIADDSKIGAHEALTPVIGNIKIENIKALNEKERNVFEAVYKRFIAAFYPPAKLNNQKILITKNGETFNFNVTDVVELGYKEVFGENLKDSKVLIGVKQGDIVDLNELHITEHDTEPPKRLTEGALIQIMKNPSKYVDDKEEKDLMKKVEGIGTEATRSGIIQRLKVMQYIELIKKGKNDYIHPTDKGIAFIDIIPSENIKSVSLTAKVEQGLGMIEDGKATFEKFMERIKVLVSTIVTEIKNINVETIQKIPSTSSPDQKPFKLKCFWDNEEREFVENERTFSSVSEPKIIVYKNALEKSLKLKKITLKHFKELIQTGKTKDKVKLYSFNKKKDFEAYLTFDSEEKKVWISF